MASSEPGSSSDPIASTSQQICRQNLAYETNTYPSALTTGFSNPFLRCPMPDCTFRCRNHIMYSSHVQDIHLCEACGSYCSWKSEHRCLAEGQRLGHVDAGYPLDLSNFAEISRSHLGVIKNYNYRHPLDTNDLETAFTMTYEPLAKLLTELLVIHGNMRVELTTSVLMEKDITLEEGGEITTKTAMIYFKSANHDLFDSTGIQSLVWVCAAEIVDKKETFLQNGSNWRVVNVESLEVKVGELRLFQNARVRGYLPLPFKDSRVGYINFKNMDNECFKYCVAAALFRDDKIAENKLLGMKNRNLENPNTWKKFFSRIDFSNISEGFVNPYEDLPVFEENNNCAINVFTHKGERVIMMRPSRKRSANVINLFLIHKKSGSSTCDSPADTYHYVLISNLEKFLQEKGKRRLFYCIFCFRKFNTKGKQLNHQLKCKSEAKDDEVEGENNEAKIKYEFPPENQSLKFQRLEMLHPFPYYAAFDFECYSQPVEEENQFSHGNEGGKSSATIKKYEYIPASYSLVIVHNTGTSGELESTEYYCGPNPVSHFFSRAFFWAQALLTRIRNTNNRVTPTDEEMKLHETATHCKHCKRKFNTQACDAESDLAYDLFNEEGELLYDSSDESVRDENLEEPREKRPKDSNESDVKVVRVYNHDHISGRYVSTICAGCNLKIRYKYELPLIVHGGSNFDYHLLLKYADTTYFNYEDIFVIAKTGEKFVQMNIPARDMLVPPLYSNYGGYKCNQNRLSCGNRKVRLRFLDSCQFQPSSLAKLVNRLQVETSPHFSLLNQVLENYLYPSGTLARPDSSVTSEEAMELLLAKIPFPYGYLSSPDKLKPGVPIPERHEFNNELTHELCSDKQWNTIRKICEVFKIRDFNSYTRLYCILDSTHLSICWLNFILNGINNYQLDATYTSTCSSYSWQCWLYSSGESIEYIRDKKMYDMVKAGIRGGQSFATRKITRANTPRNPLGYDPTKPPSVIIYFDVVSLYSHAMQSFKYPHSNYQWMDVASLECIDWQSRELLSEENSTGYILSVDLEYPESIHDYTASLPLCPEKRCVKLEWLSEQQRATLMSLGRVSANSFLSVPKLLLHCFPRYKYVVHYRTLGFWLRKGIKLVKIHSGFSFTERPYLQKFIQENIERRKVAKTESERSDIKLIMNGTYGRTLKNDENNFTVKFCRSAAKARWYLANPECVDFQVLNEKVSIVKLKPRQVVLGNLIQCGMSVLELAKLIFYSGYYDTLCNIFKDRISVIYSDTDSVMCEILGEEKQIWGELVANRVHFDFSKIPRDHEIFSLHKNIPELRTFNTNESGKFKIEQSLEISELITSKSKCYSILFYNQTTDMKNKGIPAYTLQHACKHQTYKDVIVEKQIQKFDVNLIRSKNHTLNFIRVNKVGMHSLDLYRCYNRQHDINVSLPFGHKDLK